MQPTLIVAINVANSAAAIFYQIYNQMCNNLATSFANFSGNVSKLLRIPLAFTFILFILLHGLITALEENFLLSHVIYKCSSWGTTKKFPDNTLPLNCFRTSMSNQGA